MKQSKLDRKRFCKMLDSMIKDELAARTEYQHLKDLCEKAGIPQCYKYTSIRADEIKHHTILRDVKNRYCRNVKS